MFSLERTGIADDHVAANSDAPPPNTTILNLSLVGASVLAHRARSLARCLSTEEIPRFACVCILGVRSLLSKIDNPCQRFGHVLDTLWTLFGHPWELFFDVVRWRNHASSRFDIWSRHHTVRKRLCSRSRDTLTYIVSQGFSLHE